MRDPRNNPIERMERVLNDIDELLIAFDQANERLAQAGLSPIARPPMIEYERECVRRQLDYSRVRRTRRSVEMLRARGGPAKKLAQIEDAALDATTREMFGQGLDEMRAQSRAFTLAEIEARIAALPDDPKQYATSADPFDADR